MRVDVKALTHWVIYKGYRVRFTDRRNQRAEGVLTTAEGAEIHFGYDAANRIVELSGERIRINEYGWEVEHMHDEPSTGQ
ncbi:MAG: hypothetical protein R6W76_04850 [Caldilinea sp.]